MTDRIKIITNNREAGVLAGLAFPMMAGILGMGIFNLMDTFFVGKLGTVELAAISFTFPVVLIVSSAAHGLGMGMTAAVSKAAGMNDRNRLKNIISWGLLLALIIVSAIVIAGQLTIEPVFRALGADEQTLPVIKDYMRIWYFGAIFVVIPMVGNSAIRGLGDTRLPSMVMLIAAAINTILDPLLIFGIGPFPELGVAGAAAATVAARFSTFCVALWVLLKREKVISFPDLSAAADTWKEILFVGVPNILTKLILPFGTAVITRLISAHGREAVAGFGVAGKLEMFALIPLMALTSILPVFIGQNIGAGKTNRVIKSLSISWKFSVIYSLSIYVILLLSGRSIGSLFNDAPGVINTVALYLAIVPAAYGFRNMMDLSIAALSVTMKPVHGALISIFQMFVLYIPMAIAGSRLFGINGIFIALSLSMLITGLLSYLLTRKYIGKMTISGEAV